jgi:transcriptional regulator with XRE-family HTH domain
MAPKKRGRQPKTAPDPENVRIGERLRWSRLALVADGTQRDYAERAGLERNVYSAWESGSRRITLEGALALCKTYNLSLDWIYFGRIGTIDDETLKRSIADRRLASNSRNHA